MGTEKYLKTKTFKFAKTIQIRNKTKQDKIGIEKLEPAWWAEGGGATGNLALQKLKGQSGSKWEVMRLNRASTSSQQALHSSLSRLDLILQAKGNCFLNLKSDFAVLSRRVQRTEERFEALL